jgi:DNA helicase-2/ATP-dependent DNA helicase PcrA
MDFNKEQLEAVNHKDGASVVIAGAGSGKTTILLGRINKLVNTYEVNQEDILAISFTANTAIELKNKLRKNNLHNVKTGTFHAICREILTDKGYDMNNDQLKNWTIEKKFKEVLKIDKANSKDIMSFISYQKNNMVGVNDDFVEKESKYTISELRKCYKAYEKLKQENNCFDYDDQLLICLKELTSKKHKYKWKYVLVDEHQDNNLVQNLLIKEWSAIDNIMVVGDFRQSIYAFRAARPELFMNFYEQYKNTKVINLVTNYRSCYNIVEKSNSFIKRYYGDYEFYKDSKANNEINGSIISNIYYDRKEEGTEIANRIQELLERNVNPKDICILYRNNSHSDNLQLELKDRNIEYDVEDNGLFFKRKEINMIISVLRLILNVADDEAFDSIFKSKLDIVKFFKCDYISDIKAISGKKNKSYYESFISYNFKKFYDINNAKKFIDTLQYLKIQKDKKVSLDKIIDNIVLSFGIGEYIETEYETENERKDRFDSIDNLKKFIKNNDLESFITYVTTPIKKTNRKDAVQMMTIHKSKGLEFDNVFVIGIEDGKFPSDSTDIKEEARLFYVAVTRPKKYLHLSSIFDSRFVNEYMNSNKKKI